MADDQSHEIAELRRQLAVQGEQLERLRTLSRVDHLLKTLADALDIREVFDRVAEIAREVLPHDGMLVGQVVDDGRFVRMYVSHGLGDKIPPEVPNLSRHLTTEPWEFQLVEDVEARP